MSLTLRSDSFLAGGEIPSVHTCDGADISPHLAWDGAPRATKSFALVVEDPDAPDPEAPRMIWVHWVVYNLSPSTIELARGAAGGSLPTPARHGLNDWKRPGYGGPCPPVGRHRYVFRLYALDTVLEDLGAETKSGLERAIEGHVLATAELIGTYRRGG